MMKFLLKITLLILPLGILLLPTSSLANQPSKIYKIDFKLAVTNKLKEGAIKKTILFYTDDIESGGYNDSGYVTCTVDGGPNLCKGSYSWRRPVRVSIPYGKTLTVTIYKFYDDHGSLTWRAQYSGDGCTYLRTNPMRLSGATVQGGIKSVVIDDHTSFPNYDCGW